MVGRFILGGVLVAAIVVACEPADIEGSGLPETTISSMPTEPSGGDGACDGPKKLAAVDPSTLPPCCEGAHCLAKNKVPGKVRRSLSECPGGYCVPDSFLRSGGAPAATCTAFGNAGACASKCIPEVEKNSGLLMQDTCAADELCAPCINPLTKMATGICDLGKDGAGTCEPGADGGDATAPPPKCPHEGPPVIDPTTLPPCGGDASGAHCLDAKLVPPAMASKLASCPTGLCVPDPFIASGGQFIPATCASVGGAEGRCMNVALPDIAAQKDRLPRATCGASEVCAPCNSPLDGADTGACHLSCDPGPKGKPYVFPSCCTLDGMARGRCVPSSNVASTERANLTKDVCTAPGDLCAPAENLTPGFTPKACSAFSVAYLGNYTGVCLSACLHFTGLQALAIQKGNCDAIHQCVPCKQPTGQPTGAPGCPP